MKIMTVKSLGAGQPPGGQMFMAVIVNVLYTSVQNGGSFRKEAVARGSCVSLFLA